MSAIVIAACRWCLGSGLVFDEGEVAPAPSVPATRPRSRCWMCAGQGHETIRRSFEVDCPTCYGWGELHGRWCRACRGTGAALDVEHYMALGANRRVDIEQ